jgi:hypothetical protein
MGRGAFSETAMIPHRLGSPGRVCVWCIILPLMALTALGPALTRSRTKPDASHFTGDPFMLYPLVVQPMLRLLITP